MIRPESMPNKVYAGARAALEDILLDGTLDVVAER
jgi:hypothetical protein